MHRRVLQSLIIAAMVILAAVPAAAQEDVEPRTVGAPGRTTIGIAGFIDKFASTEERFPTHVTVHADVSRFITARLAAGAGLIGSTTVGADDDERQSGPGAAALQAFGRVLYYFSPLSMVSPYTGIEYRAPLTNRAAKDAGSALAVGGLQASLSSRAWIYVQGGYGARLSRGDEGELQTRVTAEIGVRLRF